MVSHPLLASVKLTPADETALQEILGYLNFSNGKPDPRFQKQINHLAGLLQADPVQPLFPALLLKRLDELRGTSPAFKDSTQAEQVIRVVFEQVLPAYRQHHADLLFHLQPQDFLQPFFVARVFEATLSQGSPWTDTPRIVKGALDQLNDFLGHRPVAILENGRQMQPYAHERFRPIPLYLRGAGVATSKYAPLISGALEMLQKIPPDTLAASHFDLQRLEELAVDVRAYDHSHPVYKRTNYTFGEWDPHHIDGSGRYQRFVVRMIILDSLLDWMAQSQLPQEDRIFEASAVLAGTMLMGSAVSGSGPDTHQSNVSLTSLLPKIARQRDAFYTQLLHSLKGPLSVRLLREAEQMQQPFGGIRQHLNLYLAHFGCRQMQRAHLAYLYARMGYPEAAREQANIIPSTSVRFETEIQWRFSVAHLHLDRSQLPETARLIVEIEDLLRRGIECGAIVDPWNILGFQGNFPLFIAREDSVADQRVEKLLAIMEQLLALYSRVLCEAAATGDRGLGKAIADSFRQLAEFWDRFATSTVSDLPVVRGRESYDSATHVSQALLEWNAAGEAAGDIAFWRQHVSEFQSAKAYAIVLDVLLRKRDVVAAMNLLLQWLSQSDSVDLETGPYSFYPLITHWMYLALQRKEAAPVPVATPAGPAAVPTGSTQPAVTQPAVTQPAASPPSGAPTSGAPTGSASAGATGWPVSNGTGDIEFHPDWPLVRKFFDYLEVNAGDYWSVPTFAESLAGGLKLSEERRREAEPAPPGDDLPGPDDELKHLFQDDDGDSPFGDKKHSFENESEDDLDEGTESGSDEDSENLFKAAYDNVIFRDSAADGQTGDTMDSGGPEHDTELDLLAEPMEQRLKFLVTLSQLWRMAAVSMVGQTAASLSATPANSTSANSTSANSPPANPVPGTPPSAAATQTAPVPAPAAIVTAAASARASLVPPTCVDVLVRWYHRNETILKDLGRLSESLVAHEPAEPTGDPDSLIEYDRQLHVKYALLNSIIQAQVTVQETSRILRCVLPDDALPAETRTWERSAIELLRIIYQGDRAEVRHRLPAFLKELSRRPLLYVPLDKEGKPRDILAARGLQSLIRLLLDELPRLGLLRESWHVLRTAYVMERSSPPSGMSITEFDRLLQTALRSTLEALIRNAAHWQDGKFSDEDLVELVGEVTEVYLRLWLKHSATMRLSTVESLKDSQMWRRVKAFVKNYGSDLFHAGMLTLGNLRAIVHRGAEAYLDYLEEFEDPLHPVSLLEDLDVKISRDEAAYHLETIIRCIIEKFDRFMEYNTTTTQSDYGEHLYSLLDFLRLETEYERHAWNMVPLVLAHEALSRHGRVEAATIWHTILKNKTAPLAKTHLTKLRKLERQYGIRLPSITDRLNERFVKPLALDRILAQILPAMREVRRGDPLETFDRLRSEIEQYLETSYGSANDLQPWLQSLADEVHDAESELLLPHSASDVSPHATWHPFTPEELRDQLKSWEKPLPPE